MLNINHILVPTDFSVCADAALHHGLFLAQVHDATVHVLHVAEEEVGYEVGHVSGGAAPQVNGCCADQLLDALGGDGTTALDGVNVRYATSMESDVAQAILQYAEEHDIDLIAMGTHSQHSVDRFLNYGAEHLFIGATAEKVVRMAPCPILTVGPHGAFAPEAVRRILVPVDFSEPSRRMLRYADTLSRRYQARLVLLHVLEERASQEEIEDVERRLQLMARQGGVEAEVRVRYGRLRRTIVDTVVEEKAQFLVLSSHGLSANAYARLGSRAEQMLRSARCPVFTVKVFGKDLLRDNRPTPFVRSKTSHPSISVRL